MNARYLFPSPSTHGSCSSPSARCPSSVASSDGEVCPPRPHRFSLMTYHCGAVGGRATGGVPNSPFSWIRECVEALECFNDWGGGDTTIPSPGRSRKQPLPGIGLHDHLHGRQACPKFNKFHQGVGQISLREGIFSYHPLPKRGQICYIPAPPPNC